MLRKAVKAILNAEHIVISGHLNPDGDCIGSLLALGLGLKKLGKHVYMLNYDSLPDAYKNLPGAKFFKKTINRKNIDLAISVDCSAPELLGKTLNVFQRAECILEIDHHEVRKSLGGICLIDKDAAAVGELIYDILKGLGVVITKDIAQNIMTSIIVETNSFRLPHIRPKTFEVCADMLKIGIDYHALSEMVYWARTKPALLLTGVCLSRCEFLKKGQVIWSIVYQKDFDKFKGKDQNVDAVANDMLTVKGVKAAVLFRQKPGNVFRVSLRSKENINIADVAAKYGGGGHFDSAGCIIQNEKQIIQSLLKDVVRVVK